MKVIRKRALIATAAAKYAATFQRRHEWPTDRDYTHEKQIYSRLKALHPNSPEQDIITIVGHNRLTRNICHQCNIDCAVTVAFSHEKHHMLDALPVCPSCLQEALALAGTEG